jgi:ABC-type Fe3+/spermidine/putrescine transport system ATPase subunit
LAKRENFELTNTPLLAVEHLFKTYEGAPLLYDLSFDIASGEIVCLLGPSGTGKTTLLRIIAGLEEADGGAVFFQGNNLRGVPPHARGLGFMFQDLALFPHRNVFDNVAFGLRMQTPTPSRAELVRRVQDVLDLVGLDAATFAKRDVNRLSGGEQQRVALARTLAPRPRLILFDEPLGALDRILREELEAELRALLKRLQLTALYVTHDQDEAFALADRMLLLHAGRIEQSGAPVEIYNHPANEFVARFMGLTNLLPIEKFETRNSKLRMETPAGCFVLESERGLTEAPRFVLLRPDALTRIGSGDAARENILRGRVVETQLRAGHQRLLLETAGGVFAFEWDAPIQWNVEYVFELDARAVQLLRAEGEKE